MLCEHTKSGVTEYSANSPKLVSQSALPTLQNLSYRVICQSNSSNSQSALPTYQKWSYRVLCEHTKNGVPEYSANLPKVQLQSALWGPFIQVCRVLCEPLYIGVTEYSVSPFLGVHRVLCKSPTEWKLLPHFYRIWQKRKICFDYSTKVRRPRSFFRPDNLQNTFDAV